MEILKEHIEGQKKKLSYFGKNRLH